VHGDVLGRRVVTKLLPAGEIRAADNDEHGLTPVITQFSWFNELRIKGTKGYDDMMIVALALTTSFGETRVMKVSIPAVRDLSDPRLDMDAVNIFSSTELVHKHDLEAWAVASVAFHAEPYAEENNGGGQCLILSGGDDSALVASVSVPATPEWPPFGRERMGMQVTPWWKDRRNHTAGVVAILPLNPPKVTTTAPAAGSNPPAVPVLTGSYDEFLRVFEVDSKLFRPTIKTGLRFEGGGVWRLKVLDEYARTTTATDNSQETSVHQYHYLLLASLMHAGAAVVRVTYTLPAPTPPHVLPHASPSPTPQEGTWTITPLTTFTAGHESMVYSCDARLENDAQTLTSSASELEKKVDLGSRFEKEKARPAPRAAPRYTVVSTSFYDMKICTWSFVDELKGLD
jgi:hypothetical protein